jgi:putative chitinase
MAESYAHNPEKLADFVYAGRMGNLQDGDGWKFHGRGLIQLTGRENYANCGSGIGVDLIDNPDLLLTPKYAALSAGWFWNKKGLNPLADAQEYGAMTRRINGGLTGLDERIAKITKALQVLG